MNYLDKFRNANQLNIERACDSCNVSLELLNRFWNVSSDIGAKWEGEKHHE